VSHRYQITSVSYFKIRPKDTGICTAKKKKLNQKPLPRDCTYYLPGWEMEPNWDHCFCHQGHCDLHCPHWRQSSHLTTWTHYLKRQSHCLDFLSEHLKQESLNIIQITLLWIFNLESILTFVCDDTHLHLLPMMKCQRGWSKTPTPIHKMNHTEIFCKSVFLITWCFINLSLYKFCCCLPLRLPSYFTSPS